MYTAQYVTDPFKYLIFSPSSQHNLLFNIWKIFHFYFISTILSVPGWKCNIISQALHLYCNKPSISKKNSSWVLEYLKLCCDLNTILCSVIRSEVTITWKFTFFTQFFLLKCWLGFIPFFTVLRIFYAFIIKTRECIFLDNVCTFTKHLN
jgi:hypothetical protein